ncbi:MAG: VanZ family protein, partial [Lachnospiraceae bacterium]|nr:VanZ family protein [Lachnospiraceae bacterium]
VALPLYVYGLRGMLLVLVAGVFCVSFAGLDEYHQSFVAGRSPSKRDVLIDSIGIAAGIVVTRVIGFVGRKTIFRPLANPEKEK